MNDYPVTQVHLITYHANDDKLKPKFDAQMPYMPDSLDNPNEKFMNKI